MTLLTREQILGAQDIVFEHVDVPEWGGEVILHTLTGSEREELDNFIAENGLSSGNDKATIGKNSYMAKVLQLSIVDEAGAQLFSIDDLVELGKRNSKVMIRLFKLARKISALSIAEMERYEKRFLSVQSGVSGSG
jgi:hypothetical protein